MAVEFKPGMKKDELLEIAVMNGIDVDDDMTKPQIIAALEAFNAEQATNAPENEPQSGADGGNEAAGDNNTTHDENGVQGGTEGKQDPDKTDGDDEEGNDDGGDDESGGTEDDKSGTDGGGESGEGNNTTHTEKPAEDAQEAPQGYNLFVYAGPSLPRGRLKENAVFRGTFEDVKAYLSDVLEDYPQIERLIVPANRLAAFSVKVKTPGNIAHKYYSDIVSAMRGNKEV